MLAAWTGQKKILTVMQIRGAKPGADRHPPFSTSLYNDVDFLTGLVKGHLQNSYYPGPAPKILDMGTIWAFLEMAEPLFSSCAAASRCHGQCHCFEAEFNSIIRSGHSQQRLSFRPSTGSLTKTATPNGHGNGKPAASLCIGLYPGWG
jgi:hypothetical protein